MGSVTPPVIVMNRVIMGRVVSVLVVMLLYVENIAIIFMAMLCSSRCAGTMSASVSLRIVRMIDSIV